MMPFSAHYGELFRKKGLKAESIRTREDLEQLPFTSKADLLNTPGHPEKVKEFVLIPDPQPLARRPATILRALPKRREQVRRAFQSDSPPFFLTSTTARSPD